MAPVEQYLMDRDAEIALARSAAPESVSRDATVLVLGRQGYETAVNGKNGFVCLVARGLVGPPDWPEYWSPKVRGAECLNPQAARSILPYHELRTKLALAGDRTESAMDKIRAALRQGELPALEPGAMSYMMAKGSYLTDDGDHNGPHVMFYMSVADQADWGANLHGSPVGSGPFWFFSESASQKYKDLPTIRVFTVSVADWSDGTPAAVLAPYASADTTTIATQDPAEAQIVTSDVDHFWRAFDDAAKVPPEQRAAIYAKEYFDAGSQGLKDFIPGRLKSPAALSAYVESHREFYEKARPRIRQVVAQNVAIAAAFRRLKALYPDIKFPKHVYFVVGRRTSGGTSSDDGIIMGAEMYATAPGTPYNYANLTPGMVPFYVVHETIHFNQISLPEGDTPLLQDVVAEGTADFIASLVLPEPTERQYADRWQYGCANEATLAARLLQDQDIKKLQPWMFTFTPETGWPPDMGYWMGYRIDQAFYARAKDKTAALRAMLQAKDFKAYLKASGYTATATVCEPEKPIAR